MKIRSLLLASALIVGFTASSEAQVRNVACYTEKNRQEQEQNFPELAKERAIQEQQIQQYISQHASQRQTTGTVIKIPVVIHVVSGTGCTGVFKAQILNGLEVLNKNFRRQNADTVNMQAIFKPYAADTEIEFVLARKDPQGNATEGIERVTSAIYNRDDVKTAAPAWPTDKYFNIWLVDKIYDAYTNGNIVSYSQFPGTSWNTYGAVLLQNQWGQQGAVSGSSAITNGDNATHEIAHCLNLLHFEGINCNDIDFVADTPPSIFIGSTSFCSQGQNTCNNDVSFGLPVDLPDQIENFMSYSDVACMNMFTKGQKMRMQAALNTYPQLQNLISATNAVVTGIDPGVSVGSYLPKAYFCASKTQICAGSAVTFSDLSYNSAASTWNWSFPGGSPATSGAQNPVVTYNTPGQYAVTLSAGNASGASPVTVTNYITVTAVNNNIPINPPNYFVESFEDAAFPSNPAANKIWRVQSSSVATNPANWQRVTTAFSNGTASMRLNNGAISGGAISTLLTPNFSNVSNYLFFDMAYAQKTTYLVEELKVYASTDCGVTWGSPIKALTGNQLVTNGGSIVAGAFTPTQNEWRTETLNLYPRFAGASQIMFKIEATSKNGGNLYLDNFRLMNVLGTSEEVINQHAVKVFPNPLTLETGINFELKSSEKVSVTILDVVGKTVFENNATTFLAGSHTISLADKMQGLKAGMYMVQLNLGGRTANTKLLIQ